MQRRVTDAGNARRFYAAVYAAGARPAMAFHERTLLLVQGLAAAALALVGALLQVRLLLLIALGFAVAMALFGARAWFNEASRGRARGESFLDTLGHSWESEDERRAVGAPSLVPVKVRLGRHPRVQVGLSGLALPGFALRAEQDWLVASKDGREVARLALLADHHAGNPAS